MQKQNIRLLSKDEICDFFVKNDESSFRGNQVYEWLWKKSVLRFGKMTNLSLSIRTLLENNFYINTTTVYLQQKSKDNTLKNILQLYDKNYIESVLIPFDSRVTACISSQVGCSLDCKFCATSTLERKRNLTFYEIYDQVVIAYRQSMDFFLTPLSNIVFMGMGEPLMNYKNVLAAIDKITNAECFAMAAKRITVSTSGIPKIIKKISDEKVKFNLAVSLHSAIQRKREKIMPFSSNFPLEELLLSLQYWYKKTRKKITFEYIIWQGINDKKEDIEALIDFCKKIPCKVNFIEYNPVSNFKFPKADDKIILKYQKTLKNEGIVSTIRKSRGKDIDAACGQLSNKSISI